MRYQEFVCAIEQEMNQKLKGGVTAKQYTAMKNNGKVRRGILVETPGVNVSPTIYLEEFYQRSLNGETLDQLVQEILEFYGAVKFDKSWDTKGIENYESIRDRIVFRLIHTEKNSALLREVPHIELLDLSIVFYALLDINNQGTATMTVRNEHMKCWDVTKEELFTLARRNVTSLLPAEMFTMRQAVDEVLSPSPGEKKNLLKHAPDTGDDFMYVLSNPIRSFGAACIAYPEVLDMAGQVLGEDFYILPSSVHEVVLVPESRGMDPDEMNAMVADINKTQVAEEEILSNHAYLYRREKKKLVFQNTVNF